MATALPLTQRSMTGFGRTAPRVIARPPVKSERTALTMLVPPRVASAWRLASSERRRVVTRLESRICGSSGSTLPGVGIG